MFQDKINDLFNAVPSLCTSNIRLSYFIYYRFIYPTTYRTTRHYFRFLFIPCILHPSLTISHVKFTIPLLSGVSLLLDAHFRTSLVSSKPLETWSYVTSRQRNVTVGSDLSNWHECREMSSVSFTPTGLDLEQISTYTTLDDQNTDRTSWGQGCDRVDDIVPCGV